MIKNILYSLLLHSIIFLSIYVNFHHKIIENLDLKEATTIGVVSLQEITKPVKNVVTNKEIIKTEVEKKEKIIPKKIVRPKANNKPAARPLLENKTQFKKNDDEKTKEITKKVVEEKPEEKPSEPLKEEVLQEEDQEKIAQEQNLNEAESLENLQLSAREKFNIQSQLKACYRRALLNTPPSNYNAVVKVTVLQDGTIEFDKNDIIDQNRYNNPKEKDYKNRMDSVVQTLELCSPLRNMPFDKYEVWREFTIQFDAE